MTSGFLAVLAFKPHAIWRQATGAGEPLSRSCLIIPYAEFRFAPPGRGMWYKEDLIRDPGGQELPESHRIRCNGL